MDGLIEKAMVDEWMGIWRREMATSEWGYGEGKCRCVHGSVEKGMGDESMGVSRRES